MCRIICLIRRRPSIRWSKPQQSAIRSCLPMNSWAKDDLHAVHAEDRRDGAGVSRHGHQKGDRVTICMPNCPQALHAFYGLNRIGAVSNMIHPLSAAGEIKFYLNFSHSKCILTLDQFYAKIAPIMPELDNKECKLLLAKIEDELYPHLAVGYALTAGRKYPKPPKRAITSGGRNSSASAKSATCPCRESSARRRRARPSSIPAARPARPRVFSCPI